MQMAILCKRGQGRGVPRNLAVVFVAEPNPLLSTPVLEVVVCGDNPPTARRDHARAQTTSKLCLEHCQLVVTLMLTLSETAHCIPPPHPTNHAGDSRKWRRRRGACTPPRLHDAQAPQVEGGGEVDRRLRVRPPGQVAKGGGAEVGI